MTQALANHNPDDVVVDEIGSSAEVEAVRSICQRGVVMVGAHLPCTRSCRTPY
jgi:stage III sporulation protein SpoIIIAA